MAVLVTVYRRASVVGKFQVRAQFSVICQVIDSLSNNYDKYIVTNTYIPRDEPKSLSLFLYPSKYQYNYTSL